MDVVSDVITTLRTGAPGGATVGWDAPFGVRFADEPGVVGFLVVLHGSAWLRSEGSDAIALGPGDVVFSPHGGGYGLADSPSTPLDPVPLTQDPPDSVPSEASSVVTVCGGYRIDPDRSHPLLRELPHTLHIKAQLGRHQQVRAAVEILAAEIDGQRPGADAMVPIALDLLLLYVIRTWVESRTEPTESGWASALTDDATAAALHAMHGDPAHRWTVQELAGHARLSRAAFARRFTELVGQPPLSYLTWWRLTKAAELLRESAEPLSSIATRVGYTSEFAFANAFKRAYGIAPGRFRRHTAA